MPAIDSPARLLQPRLSLIREIHPVIAAEREIIQPPEPFTAIAIRQDFELTFGAYLNKAKSVIRNDISPFWQYPGPFGHPSEQVNTLARRLASIRDPPKRHIDEVKIAIRIEGWPLEKGPQLPPREVASSQAPPRGSFHLDGSGN